MWDPRFVCPSAFAQSLLFHRARGAGQRACICQKVQEPADDELPLWLHAHTWPVLGEIFGHHNRLPVEILVFASPTDYMLTSSDFRLIKLGNILQIPLK